MHIRMMNYIFLLIFLILSYLLLYRINVRNKKRIFLIFSFLGLSFLSCFRDFSVGADTQQWVDFYTVYGAQGLNAVNFSQPHEPGYVLLNVILWQFSHNPRLLIIFGGLFINFSFCYFVDKHSKDPFLSVLIWYCFRMFFGSMCLFRQFLAISIVLLSFDLLLHKKYIRFAFAVVIASMFHYIALAFLLLIPIRQIEKVNLKYAIIIALIFSICFLFLPQLVEFFLKYVSNYSDYFSYMQENKIIVGEFHFQPFLFVFLAYMLPLAFSCYRRKDIFCKTDLSSTKMKSKKIESYNFIMIIFIVIICLIALSSRLILISRINEYFMPFVMLVPNIVDTNRNKELKVYYIALNIAYFAYMLLASNQFLTNDFYFFWE